MGLAEQRAAASRAAKLARARSAPTNYVYEAPDPDDGWQDVDDDGNPIKKSRHRRTPASRSRSEFGEGKPRRHWTYTRALAEAHGALEVERGAPDSELDAALEAKISSVLLSNRPQSVKAATFRELKEAHSLILASRTRKVLARQAGR